MTKARDPLRISVEPREVTLAPGAAPVTVDVRVANLSTVVDEFVVWVSGDVPWLEAPGAKIRVLPNRDGFVQLSLGVRDGQLPTAGVWRAAVRVRSASTGATQAEPLSVSVPTVVGDTTLSLEPTVVRGGSSAHLVAHVHNGGNAPLRLALHGRDPESAVTFRIRPAELEVPPASTTRATVEVSAPRPLRGGERHRPFTVSARDGHRTVEANGTFVQAPTVTRGRLAALRAALTVAGGLGLVAGAFLPWNRLPPRLEGLQWSYARYTAAIDVSVPQPPQVLAEPFMTLATSAGLLVVVLGVLALLGLIGRRGRLTMLAGGLAVVFIVGFAGLLAVRGGGGPAVGAWVVGTAGVVALVGGGLAEG